MNVLILLILRYSVLSYSLLQSASVMLASNSLLCSFVFLTSLTEVAQYLSLVYICVINVISMNFITLQFAKSNNELVATSVP